MKSSWTGVKRSLCAVFCCAAVMGPSKPAAAQETLKELVTANSGLILTLVLMTTASTVTYITQGLTDRLLDQMFADTQRYMMNNAVALSQDISMGGGESLRDLATIYGLPLEEHGAFCRQAYAHRDELVELLQQEQVTRADAEQFVYVVLSEEQVNRYQ